MKQEEEPGFGKGQVYCLGLFLMHAERDIELGPDYYWLWFNGAYDHLYELQLTHKDKKIEKKLQKFERFCLQRRSEFLFPNIIVKQGDKEKALNMALEILKLIDEYNKVETKEAEYK